MKMPKQCPNYGTLTGRCKCGGMKCTRCAFDWRKCNCISPEYNKKKNCGCTDEYCMLWNGLDKNYKNKCKHELKPVLIQEFTKATTMSSLTSKLPTKTKAQLFDRIIELYWEHGPLGLRIQTSEDGDELRVWTDTNVRTDFSLLFKAPI